MNFPTHQISASTLSALASGGGGADAVRPLVIAQHSKHLLLVWGVMDTSRRTGHAQAGHARRGYELLADIQRHAPGVVEAVLRHPSVGAWADRTLRLMLTQERPAPGARMACDEPAQLAALAAAAAIRARYPCALEVPVRGGVITLPSVGQVALPPESAPDGLADVRYTPRGARVIVGRRLVLIPRDTKADGPGWRGLRAVHATARGMTLRLMIDDLDPHRMPALEGLSSRLGHAEAARWQRILRRAWNLLANLPGTAAEEIEAAIRVLTPLRRPADGDMSASSREVFGCVALSPPTDGLALAVTLAHESQHAKLGALLDLVTLTRPDDGQRFYAPWRDDPRPIAALLQGAYAYLGVSGFWRWQRHAEQGAAAARAHAEFARWRDAASMATRVMLVSGQLTEDGHTFATGMAETLRDWADDEVPPAALAKARADNERHRLAWLRRHGASSRTGLPRTLTPDA